jgi:phage tail sheath protein FI
MSDPYFGVTTRRNDSDAVPGISADLSTVGMVGPADDADAIAFPLDTPVRFYSNDVLMLAKLGKNNLLVDAVRGINDQLAPLQRAAQCIAVRTATGASNDPATRRQQTIANAMGSSTSATGIYALLKAPQLCNATPRLIITPGLDSQLATGVDTVTAGTAGAGYEPDQVYPLTFSGGGAGAIQATGYATARSDGSITAADVTIDSHGAWYTSAPAVAIAAPANGGTQAVFTATTAVLGNPLVAAANAVLTGLLGHAVFESAGTSEAADLAYRETINSERIIPVSGGVRVQDPATGEIVVRPFAPRLVGAIIATDFENGGAPFHSAANRPIYGIVGPARPIVYSTTGGENEGQRLLTAGMGILVQGETGNDFAIASGGYIAIALDNAGEDDEWKFYNQTRGRDFINITNIRATRYFLGRSNITAHTVQSILNMLDSILSILQSREHIIGFKTGFQGSLNSAEEIRAGAITVSFRAEEPAPLRKVTIVGGRYREAVVNMVAAIEASLNLSV